MYGAAFGQEAYGSMSDEIAEGGLPGRDLTCLETAVAGTDLLPADCDPDT